MYVTVNIYSEVHTPYQELPSPLPQQPLPVLPDCIPFWTGPVFQTQSCVRHSICEVDKGSHTFLANAEKYELFHS